MSLNQASPSEWDKITSKTRIKKRKDVETLQDLADKHCKGLDDKPCLVNSPPHYNHSGLECIDVLKAILGRQGFLSYLHGTAFAYLYRAEYKGDYITDVQNLYGIWSAASKSVWRIELDTFEVGVYENLTYEEYAAIPAWRSHDLTELIKCPYRWRYKRDISESPALLEGRVQHTVFSELEKFDNDFAIEPAVDRRTKVGKEAYADWLETVGDRTPIKQDLFDVCMERREVLAEYIPSDGDSVEVVICWKWHGHPCKGRIDWHTGMDIWDLKTCRDASPRGFRSAINNFRYYQQAAFYLNGARLAGLPSEKFYFLAVEKAHPYPFGVYTLSDEAIAYGEAKNEQALAIGLECRKKEEYTPFNAKHQVIEVAVDELH